MNKQLGTFEKKKLIRYGKKDARIYKKRESTKSSNFELSKNNIDQTVYMQFINQEIARCLSMIHVTTNRYLKKNLKIEKNINTKHYRINVFKEKKHKNDLLFETEEEFLNALRIQLGKLDNFSNEGNPDKQDDINDELEEIVYNANIFERETPQEVMLSIQEEKRKKREEERINSDNKLDKKINRTERSKQKKNIINTNFAKALTEECKHFYSLTLARISAYWTGVLTINDYKIDIIKVIDEKDVFNSIDDEINKLKNLFEDDKSDEEMNENEG